MCGSMQMRMKHIDTSAMYQLVTEEKKVDTTIDIHIEEIIHETPLQPTLPLMPLFQKTYVCGEL